MQWTRNPIGGIISEHVKDFGLLPISPGARRSFSRVMQNSLVGVAAQRWAANRHTPVLHADLAAPPPIHYTHAFVLAAAQFVTGLYGPTAGAILYAGVPPTITFDSARISTFVHNLPPGVPAVEDLVLDLGRLFFEVQRIAALVVPVPPVAAI